MFQLKKINNKLFLFSTAVLIVFFISCYYPSYADNLTLSACGFSLKYPSESLITKLSTNAQLTHVVQVGNLNKQCSWKISLPIQEKQSNLIAKSLFVLHLVSPQKLDLPVQKGKWIKIGGVKFYSMQVSDAGMCHQRRLGYYFPNGWGRNPVLVTRLESVCVGVTPQAKRAFNEALEQRAFLPILGSYLETPLKTQ